MWLLTPDQRLAEWKKFRKQLSDLDAAQAIKSTSHLWSYAPFVNHYLDHDAPSTWPDPWSLVAENYYCDLAKSACMLYTLALSSHDFDLELRIYEDQDHNFYNTVWIDGGKYVISYEFDTVVNKTQIDEAHTLRYCYSPADLNIEQQRK